MSQPPIGDPRDPRVADYADLRQGSLLAKRGLFVVESRHVVRRLLQGRRFVVRSLLLTPAAARELAPVLSEVDEGPPVHHAPPALMAELAGHRVHQGCLALAERGPELDAQAVAGTALRGSGLLLVLEGLADPDNVGSVFRNARAFGVAGIWLAEGGANPLYRKAIRVSMGATLEVPFARVKSWPGDLEALGDAGFRRVASVAAPEEGALDASRCHPEHTKGPVALLLGGEGTGLSREAREACEDRVHVPTAVGLDSLNVATASGILLHRWARLG